MTKLILIYIAQTLGAVSLITFNVCAWMTDPITGAGTGMATAIVIWFYVITDEIHSIRKEIIDDLPYRHRGKP